MPASSTIGRRKRGRGNMLGQRQEGRREETLVENLPQVKQQGLATRPARPGSEPGLDNGGGFGRLAHGGRNRSTTKGLRTLLEILR